MLIAGLLHDTVEDTDVVSLDEIGFLFGVGCKRIVEGETKFSKLTKLQKDTPKEELQAMDLQQLFLAMAEDARIIVVKLADRLHNMRTMASMPAHKQAKIASETLRVFAPLAGLLGLWAIKTELQDLSLMYTKPEVYTLMMSHRVKLLVEQQSSSEEAMEALQDMLRTDTHLSSLCRGFKVSQRMRPIYSMYLQAEAELQSIVQKLGVHYPVKDVPSSRLAELFVKHKVLDKVNDATRVHVVIKEAAPASVPGTYGSPEVSARVQEASSSAQLCYLVLGRLHSVWAPVPGSIKDYIATPKRNGYQGLHSVLLTLGCTLVRPLHVIIHTESMQRLADYGIAADNWRSSVFPVPVQTSSMGEPAKHAVKPAASSDSWTPWSDASAVTIDLDTSVHFDNRAAYTGAARGFRWSGQANGAAASSSSLSLRSGVSPGAASENGNGRGHVGAAQGSANGNGASNGNGNGSSNGNGNAASRSGSDAVLGDPGSASLGNGAGDRVTNGAVVPRQPAAAAAYAVGSRERGSYGAHAAQLASVASAAATSNGAKPAAAECTRPAPQNGAASNGAIQGAAAAPASASESLENGTLHQDVHGRAWLGRDAMTRRVNWLNSIREWQDEFLGTLSATEFMECMQNDLLGQTVFCFTPSGDVMRLPKGATIVDFAYHVHSEIGNNMVSAKVNGRIVPVGYELQNADVVQIVAYSNPAGKIVNAMRHRDWLRLAHTRSARHKLMRFLRELNVDISDTSCDSVDDGEASGSSVEDPSGESRNGAHASTSGNGAGGASAVASSTETVSVLSILCSDRFGILGEVATVIADHQHNIEAYSGGNKIADGNNVGGFMYFQIRGDSAKLAAICKRIRQIDAVKQVSVRNATAANSLKAA